MAFTVCQACPECFLCVTSFIPLLPCEVSTGSSPGKPEDLVPTLKERTHRFGVGRLRAKPTHEKQKCL